jgi:hypothetical protein
MTDLPIKIRSLSEPDKPMLDENDVIIHQEKAFIASSWAHKERANPAYFWVSKKAFHWQFYINVVCFLLDARPELFHVAHNTESPDQILGWMCADFPLVYQSYVKDDFRSKEYGVQDLLTYHYTEASPWHFMELINVERKNQAAKGSVSGSQTNSRQEHTVSP